MEALCVISGDVSGEITFFQQTPTHPTQIYGYIYGLPKGKHGMHVHEFGDISNGCTSAGEHFNPTNMDHGGPDSPIRHVGDLGNVESKSFNSLTEVNIVDSLITLHGPFSVLGRSLVVHSNKDDLGLTDHPLSKTTGNSGSRLGCGIIGIKNKNKPAIAELKRSVSNKKDGLEFFI
ncbi:superoxide dismutase [Apocheima cinerarium nucleopolyhedrovirus]|uniref:superoxide dismutase n=1 Tax=Apocheima cinerarium nucleopolyhedrovirus TaxID=307461 RepID=UPI0001D920A4|nr:superoxide dismutase [Apocheima cinerarium nucleopolyhedrovirus]ADB84438.1 superoxide dismutase [Apocheima cinerarium nucleopolyhedrovirus]